MTCGFNDDEPLGNWAARNSDPVTSRSVANNPALQVRWGSQRMKILLAYAEAVDGLIDEEAGERTGLLQQRSCYWKRCGELRQTGLIEDTGLTRMSSAGQGVIVCRITPLGRALVDSGAINKLS